MYFERLPDALNMLFDGANTGKLIEWAADAVSKPLPDVVRRRAALAGLRVCSAAEGHDDRPNEAVSALLVTLGTLRSLR